MLWMVHTSLLQAYRGLVRQLHPDKGGSAPAFAAAHAAYSVLSDPKQRAVYDAAAALRRPQDGWWAVSGCTVLHPDCHQAVVET
jgi:curved DNA-binding protein CbpA